MAIDFDFIVGFVRAHFYEALELWIPASMITMGVLVFLVEACGGVRAEYGRYNNKPTAWGLRAPIAWFVQEVPAFLVPLGFAIYNGVRFYDNFNRINTNAFLLGYFMLHYFNRSFIYTTKIKSDKKVRIMENSLAFIFCMINGAQIGHFHSHYTHSALFHWNFILGSFLFFLGFYLNIDSDNRLIQLRKTSTSGYQIPRGGLFEYVSAANYAAECLEWFGFFLASWSLPAFAFSLFTLSNIGPRAYHHHLFYKEKFGKDYPKNRKALIPFLI